MNKLINIAKKEAIMNSIFGRGNGGKFTLRQMINMIMGLVFHDFSSLTSPSKVKSDTSMPIGTNLVPNSFIFKPSSFMLTPPRCNVVMPHMYNHLAYDRNYFHEVSRVTMQPMQAIWENNKPRAFMKTYYAPNDIEKFMVPESKAADTLNPQDAGPPGQGNYKDELDKKNSATTKKRDFHYFSYEEILKGIFHEMGHATPNSSTFSRYMNEAEQGSFYQQATDYLFHEKRYAARNTTTSGPLNIAPVVGFPIMIMDDSPANQTIIGVLQSISHSVGAKSGASTSYTITFSRPLFEPDMWTGEYTEPPIPPWYDKKIFGDRRGVRDTDWNKLPKKYHNQFEKSVKNVNDYSNIGNYYTKVLGDSGPSYLTGHKPLTTKNFPITLSATYSLIEKYNAIADQDKFLYTSKYTARDYVKFHEIFGFLGADNLNESASYSLNPPKEVNGTRFNGGYVDNTGDDLNSIDKNLKKYFGPEAFKRRRAAVKQYRDIVLSRKATT
ncbi:MAG: hypothetical protein DRI46_12875 [Chloroflexi bacterium]|nr:MAG: hypothetical protein DRI46_12875 [Chloroflexota bacterium]